VLVTVILRAPVVAPVETLSTTVIVVELVTLVVPTVIPVPEMDTIAPVTKPVPVSVTVCSLVPCPSALGLALVGTGPALIVKQPAHEAAPSIGLLTVTVRAPVAAPDAIVTFTEMEEELLNVVLLTVMPGAGEKLTVAPGRKLLPATSRF
jgi:hypothetical protein